MNSNSPSGCKILFYHNSSSNEKANADSFQAISKVCLPFYKFEIRSDENQNDSDKTYFELSFLRNNVMPNIMEKIHSFDSDTINNLPAFTKLIVTIFEKPGLDLINSTIFHLLEEMLSTSNLSKPSLIFDVYFKCLASISEKYRDDILIYKIQQFSASQESNFRIIAVRLIPYVYSTQKIITNFMALSLDRVPLVRSTVIQSLTDPGIFDLPESHQNDGDNNTKDGNVKDFKTRLGQEIVDSILNSSVHDLADSVQRTAATTIGIVAPHLIEPIRAFLGQRRTSKAALTSVKSIVSHSSFKEIYDAFQNAIKFQPENSCAVLINISKIVKKEEHPLLLECAKALKGYITLINYLHKFSEAFEDKEIFLSFLDPTTQKRWRSRSGLLKQAILFIPTFQRKLVPIAKSFACDDIAIIRNMSVELWANLIKSGEALVQNSNDESRQAALESATKFEDLCEIISVGFHQRLVVCKVIGRLGYNDEKYGKITDDMSKDPVPNVRICMARNLIGSGSFDKFFSQSQDPEIAALREADREEMEKEKENKS